MQFFLHLVKLGMKTTIQLKKCLGLDKILLVKKNINETLLKRMLIIYIFTYFGIHCFN